MAQILSIAQSIGGSASPEAPPSASPAASASIPAFSMPDEGFVTGIMQLMQQARQADGKQEALLLALRPYLASERQARLDRAMEIARISHLAGTALRNYGGLLGKGGGHV